MLKRILTLKKISTHDIRMKKKFSKSRRTLSGFIKIFTEFCGSKAELASPHKNFISDVANPKIVSMLAHFQILCTD